MPYQIRKFKTGYKVCKKSNPDECYSKEGIPLERAKKQLKAIAISDMPHKVSNPADKVSLEAGAGAKPLNQELYNEIKEKVYREQPRHSLYRSARIQKEYKERGGTYDDEELPNMNIKKWFKQQWISLNDYLNDNIVPCGNSKIEDSYPLCRPLAIAEKLTKPEIREMIKEKQKLKSKPLKTEKIIGSKRLNIKPTITGLGMTHNVSNLADSIRLGKKEKKLKQLPRKLLLLIAKKVAKERGYNPNNLRLSKDKIHKLEYNDNNKWVKFGAVKYMDFPTYLYNYTLGNITKEEAFKKMRNYRKRAKATMEKTKNKYSPASLSYFILW